VKCTFKIVTKGNEAWRRDATMGRTMDVTTNWLCLEEEGCRVVDEAKAALLTKQRSSVFWTEKLWVAVDGAAASKAVAIFI